MTDITQAKIKTIPIEQINPAPYNPRAKLQPDDARYKEIDGALRDFGMVEVLVWNERTGNLVGGHQRLNMLIADGHKKVQVAVVDLDDAKEKALNLALNKLDGFWDFDALEKVVAELNQADFDLGLTGFSDEEITELLQRSGGSGSFLDDLTGAGAGSGGEEGNGSGGSGRRGSSGTGERVTFSVLVNGEQRDLIRRALAEAKKRGKLRTTQEALCEIAGFYLEYEPTEDEPEDEQPEGEE